MLSAFYAFQFIRTWVNNKIGHIAEDAMMKADYDTDGDGVVDNAKRLNGNLSSYYAKESDMIHGFVVDDNGNLCQKIDS